MNSPQAGQPFQLFPLYQRIVRLTDPSGVFAMEATMRGVNPHGKAPLSPARLFREAEKTRTIRELDFQARQLAIRHAPSPDRGGLLFLNCHAESLETGRLFEEKEALPFPRIVLEIMENIRLRNVASVVKKLEPYRARGVKIALDDFGAGFSNLALVEALRPDYIKLDRRVVETVDRTEQGRRVIAGMVAFAEQTQASLIAEGIERTSQKQILKSLGVEYGQGFLLGYPAPAAAD